MADDTQTGSNLKATLKALRTALISQETNRMSNGQTSKIVNILTNYPWSLGNMLYKAGDTFPVLPCAYIQEYENTSATWINSLAVGLNGISTSSENFTLPQTILDTVTSVFSDKAKEGFVKWLSQCYTDTKSSELNTLLSSPGDSLLLPYLYTYGLDSSNCNKYIMPYFDDDMFSFKSSYSDKSSNGSWIETSVGAALDASAGFWKNVSTGMIDQAYGSMYQQFSGSLVTDNNNGGVFLDKPKYFEYSSEGETVNIRFTLYNTILRDATTNDSTSQRDASNVPPWIKNFRFIRGFALKNLPFKISTYDYLSPVLYSIQIPGTKFLPVAYVSSFSAKLIGTRRFLSFATQKFEKEDPNDERSKSVSKPDDYTGQVLVPEAWDVEITFTSLFAKSFNLAYAGFYNTVNVKYT